MRFTDLFIKRPITTTLLMVAILVFGLISYFSLPVSNLPAVEYPTIQVSASLPGANPDTMAASVATPLETEFSTIAGINSMSSSSSLGVNQHHAAVRSEPEHRRSRPGCAGRYFASARQSADQHASAAFVLESEPGGTAHHVHCDHIADDVDVAVRPVCRKHAGAAALHGDRRVASGSVRFGQVCRARASGSAEASRPARSIWKAYARRSQAAASICRPARCSARRRLIPWNPSSQLTSAAQFGRLIVSYHNGSPVHLDELANVVDSVSQHACPISGSMGGARLCWQFRNSRERTRCRWRTR